MNRYPQPVRSVLTTSTLFAVLCFLGFVSMLFSTITLVGSLVVGPAPGSILEACCGTVLARLSVGWLLFAAVALAAFFVVVRTARSLWRLIAAGRRVKALRRVSEPIVASGVSCRMYEDSRPLAFCAGLLRPEVYVSRAAVEEMSPDVLRVVMAHEEHHRVNRDPLRRAIARTLAEGFFFLPVLGQVGQKYLALSEIRADRAAAGSTDGGRRDVADALLAFPASDGTLDQASASKERVDDLTGERGIWTPSRSMIVATLVALTALLSAPVLSVELLTSVPVGFEALGLHVCLLILTMTPMVLAAAMTWSRPSFQLR